MLRVTNHYPTTVTIDGEPIKLRVVKFDRRQDIDFSTEFDFINREQFILDDEVKRFTADYRARLADARGVTPDDIPETALPHPAALIGLLEASLSAEDAAARRTREVDTAERGTAFAVKAIADFISVEPGQIYDETAGREVLTGGDLAAHFEARDDIRQLLLATIVEENRLSVQQKKSLSLLRAFRPISASPTTIDGPKPAETAAGAAPSTTAAIGPATDGDATSPSGATTGSNVSPVPSSATRQRSNGGSRGSTRPTRSSSRTAAPAMSATASQTPAGSDSKRPN